MSVILKFYANVTRRSLLSWRMFSAVLLTVMTMDCFLMSIRKYCVSQGVKMTQWGFALIWNNKYVGLCFLLIFIYAVSNFPLDREKERYYIARLGVSKWIAAQGLYVLSFGWLYTAFLFALENLLLLPVLEWSSEWGNGWIALSDTNIVLKYELYISTSRSVLSNYTPGMANLLVFLNMGFLLGMLGSLVLWLNAYSRMAGPIAASAVVFLGLAAAKNPSLYRYSPTTFIQLNNQYSSVNPDYPTESYIIMMLLLLTVLCLALAFMRVRETQENNRRKL